MVFPLSAATALKVVSDVALRGADAQENRKRKDNENRMIFLYFSIC
jgi:hypothetical protein